MYNTCLHNLNQTYLSHGVYFFEAKALIINYENLVRGKVDFCVDK